MTPSSIRCARRGRDRMLLVVALITPLTMHSRSSADSVKNVRSRIEQPLAIHGGVLLLPLVADKPGNNWPQSIELTLPDHQVIEAQVAWIAESSPRVIRRWTDDSRNLTIRAVQPEDDTSTIDTTGGIGPYLLARLPARGDGEIHLGKQKLKPYWRNLPSMPALQVDQQSLELTEAPDRPDPDSPFEYWRWILLAERLGMGAPPPTGSEFEQLIARHYAELWR